MIKSNRMRWVGHEARMRDRRGFRGVLEVRCEGKRSLERPRLRWEEDTIKRILKKWSGLDCFGLIGAGGVCW